MNKRINEILVENIMIKLNRLVKERNKLSGRIEALIVEVKRLENINKKNKLKNNLNQC